MEVCGSSVLGEALLVLSTVQQPIMQFTVVGSEEVRD